MMGKSEHSTPPARKNPSSKSAISKTVRIERSGPLPPPSEFSAYEKTQTGAANRILTMAEQAQQHQIDKENAIIKHQARLAMSGLIVSNVTPIISLVGGVVVSALQNSVVPLIVGSGFSCFVYIFVKIVVHKKE